MQTGEIRVTFQPSGRSVYVLPGTILLEAAGRAGIILQSPCGGRGTCGKCRVRLAHSDGPLPAAEPGPLSAEQIAQGYRLACRTPVTSACVVEVPRESTFDAAQQILTSDDGVQAEMEPLVAKRRFELAPPSQEDPRSDLSRLRDALDGVELAPPLVRQLPAFLRREGWRGTAVLSNHHMLALEPGDTTDQLFGVAVDLGTTTVVGKLIDLNSGEEKAVASQMNPQVAYGDDVISRISHARDHGGGLIEMQTAVLGCLNTILETLCQQSGVPSHAVYEIVLAGNSTMQQILCGYSPAALGEVPFVQVFEHAQQLSAAALGLKANPCAGLYVFPQIGGFVGGDTVAGMVASRLDRWPRPVLLVDIGTNGEIVLAANGHLLATSTAAGPAFEGARIRQGMRATAGAIEKVILRDDVVLNVIGNAKPAGLCGTALIDAAAELLRHGLLDETGRLLPADEAPAATPPALLGRLVTRGTETDFLLAPAEQSATGEDIFLWQRDIRELQLATGAVRAGISILLRRAGVEPQDLDRVLLAGAFGNFIRRSNARRIGLLPQVPCECIRFIGNAASLGARLVLCSAAERAYADSLQQRSEHVDLSLDPEFQMEFGMAMLFPDGEMDTCADR